MSIRTLREALLSSEPVKEYDMSQGYNGWLSDMTSLYGGRTKRSVSHGWSQIDRETGYEDLCEMEMHLLHDGTIIEGELPDTV